MRYCEMETQGPALGFCGERASLKFEGCWLCEHHAEALEQAQARWSGVNWFPIRYTESNKHTDLNDPDGWFWDEEDSL